MLQTQETWVWLLGWEDPLEEEITTDSNILAWRIPWTEEPGGLQSTGLQRVRHEWSDLARSRMDGNSKGCMLHDVGLECTCNLWSCSWEGDSISQKGLAWLLMKEWPKESRVLESWLVRKLGESIRKLTLPLSLWKVEFHIPGVVFWNCRPEVKTKDYVSYFKHEETSSLCFSSVMN